MHQGTCDSAPPLTAAGRLHLTGATEWEDWLVVVFPVTVTGEWT